MKLLNTIVVLIFFFFSTSYLHAQNTAISDTAYRAHRSAVLDVYSTKKGLLVPRLTEAEKMAVQHPAKGLLIFQTNAKSGYYYYNGYAWTPFLVSSSGWMQNGNNNTDSKPIGTIDNKDFSIITNNTVKMQLTKEGQVGIGSSSFNKNNPERLLVDYGNTNSNTLALFRGGINKKFLLNVQNTNNGNDASTDIVATADNGTDSTNFIDFGINSSNYLPSSDNFGGPNDGYLFTNSNNLLLGTHVVNTDVQFLAGGNALNKNEALRIDGSSKNIIVGLNENTSSPQGNIIRGPHASGNNVNGSDLTLQGGNANGVAPGGNLILNGGDNNNGYGGQVNVNKDENNPTNINSVSSNKVVTIGNSTNNIYLPKWSAVGGIYFNAAASGVLANSGILNWDNNRKRLGINTGNPKESVEVMNGNIALTNINNEAGKLSIQHPMASKGFVSTFSAKAQETDLAYTLPASQGSQNSMLLNNGSGNLTWGGDNLMRGKIANESVTDNNILQDDNDFTYVLAANQTYAIEGLISASAGKGALKVCFNAPQGSKEFINVSVNRPTTDDINYITDANTAAQVAFDPINAQTDQILINGTITTGATGGTFKMQWSQQNGDPTPTTLYAGSYIGLTYVK